MDKNKDFLVSLSIIAAGFVGVIFVTFVFAQTTSAIIPFSKTLLRGSSGDEVKRLQEFLKTLPDIYPEGIVTGYFGLLTEKAVKQFQAKYGIERAGILGPQTRAKLNSLNLPQNSRQQTQQTQSQLQQQHGSSMRQEVKINSEQNGMQKRQPTPVLAEQFAALEKELLGAKMSGSYLAPAHYERVKQDLAVLEGGGYSANETKRLRELALKLAPYLQDQQKTRTPAATTPLFTASSTLASFPCIGNANPKLTADITDFSKIQRITAPGSPSREGPKGHSFIWTGGQRIPIYAPAPAILDNGFYGADNIDSPFQYGFTFQVKGYCDFQFRFGHIDEPIDIIKAVLPATPKIADSRGTQAASRVEFKAGDLLGYTFGTRQAGNWDFGLYNMSKEGALAGYGSYGVHKHAVCWVDFYAADKQERYRNLLEGPRTLCSFREPAAIREGNNLPTAESQPEKQAVITKEDKAPVFKNLGVSFGPWDKSTNRAGAFIFLPSENKVFLEYGAEVKSSEGGVKILPTFEYRTVSDADVFAAIDGVVTNVVYQDKTQDYAIHIQPAPNSQWILEHDHISNLRISKGDMVKAGDILGKVGSLGGGLGRTEIMFWNSSATRPLTYCPFKYFDPQLLSEYQQKVLRHMKDWEEFKGNPNLYDEEKHIFPGCAYENLLD